MCGKHVFCADVGEWDDPWLCRNKLHPGQTNIFEFHILLFTLGVGIPITSLQKLKWGSSDYWHLLPCFPHTVTIAVKMWEVQGGVRGRNGERKGGNDHDWNLKTYLTNRKRCWKWKINPQSRWSCMINSPLQFSTIAFFLLYSLLLPGLFYWQHPPCYVSYSCPVPPASLLF